jgi:hypothetical protein
MRLLKMAGWIGVLFGAGIGLGVGYRYFQGSIFPAPVFVAASDDAALSDSLVSSANVAAENNMPASTFTPWPGAPAGMVLNAPLALPPTPASQTNHKVVEISPPKPPNALPVPGGNQLMLPSVQPKETADRLPVVGSQGETIWVPRAIEGCWEGTGGSRLQYLGGCPNLVSGSGSPIKLRWCFQRMGKEPLTLTMAKGKYPGSVSQHWNVTWARGQTIALSETISYMTMMIFHVVDVGDWTCRITPDDDLVCQERELAHCGPTRWMQGPWFRGSGWVTATRVGAGNRGPHVASRR